jgi:hypothetical protein
MRRGFRNWVIPTPKTYAAPEVLCDVIVVSLARVKVREISIAYILCKYNYTPQEEVTEYPRQLVGPALPAGTATKTPTWRGMSDDMLSAAFYWHDYSQFIKQYKSV